MNAYKTNIACSVFFLAMAGAVWLLIPAGIVSSGNYTAGNAMLNSQFMPRVLAIVLAFASLVNLLMNVLWMHLAKQAGKPAPTIPRPAAEEEKNVLWVAGITLAYVLLLRVIGFLPATCLATMAILAFLRVRKWHYYAISVAFDCLVYYVFTNFLYVTLP